MSSGSLVDDDPLGLEAWLLVDLEIGGRRARWVAVDEVSVEGDGLLSRVRAGVSDASRTKVWLFCCVESKSSSSSSSKIAERGSLTSSSLSSGEDASSSVDFWLPCPDLLALRPDFVLDCGSG